MAAWRGRLADHLAATYPDDGFVQDGRLLTGTALPAAREWLLPTG